MTTSFSSTPTVNTLAQYNAYFSAVRAAILSFGWVQTSDTGQVDFTTNAAFPAIGTHYQLFRPADALQSTAPFILRIGYGNSASIVQMTVQLGSETDGAGNFINNFTAPISLTNGTSGSATAMTSYGAGDTDRFWLALNATVTATGVASGNMMFLSFERSKDSLGDNTGDFATIFCSGASATGLRQVSLHQEYGPTQGDNAWVAPMPYNSLNLGFNGAGGTVPVFPFLGRVENPSKDMGLCKFGDFAHGSIITCESYNLNRSYRVFDGGASSNNNSTSAVVPTVSTAARAAILARWE